jgi:ethanolamine utilization protein EutA
MTEFLTVGIDIGTTSTHLSFSRLILGNTARPNEPVRMAVIERIPVYQSEIYRTPLTEDDCIDAPQVVALVKQEYAMASVASDEIATGAVIITGETAKKRNAESIVEHLSLLAGNLVAASAGPHLESILAARGSGACDASRDGLKICNIDVGGGTSNIAVCEKGKVSHTDWLRVGGRVCTAESVEEAARQLCDAVQSMAESFWFSGGVAEIMRRLQLGDMLKDDMFGDAGVLLARALLAEATARNMPCHIPQNAIRATVIGAGAYSFELSGSTVSLNECELPIRNLPLLRVSDVSELASISKRFEKPNVALMFDSLSNMNYNELKQFASQLAAGILENALAEPFVILMQRDMAAALGQLLSSQLPGKALIVLDGVGTEYGDYIDIGQPMSNGQFVPVVVKELVFAG